MLQTTALWSYGIRSRLHDAGLCSGLVCHAILRLASDSPTSGFPTPSRLDSRLRAFEFFAILNSVSEAVRVREQQGACNVRSGGGTQGAGNRASRNDASLGLIGHAARPNSIYAKYNGPMNLNEVSVDLLREGRKC